MPPSQTPSSPTPPPPPSGGGSAGSPPPAPGFDAPITPLPQSQSAIPNSLPPISPPTETAPPASPPPPPTSTPSSSPKTPASKPPKSGSPLKFLLPLILVLAVIGAIAFIVIRFVLPSFSSSSSSSSASPTPSQKTTITYQGLWEPASVMQPVLDEFEKQNPDIKVNYQMQSQVDYRERLQTELTSTNPPDVVRYHSTWLPMLITNLQPAPAGTVTTAEITSNFYPVVSDAVVVGSQVYGLPTTMEGLAMYVNTDLLASAQATVPKDWIELRETAKKITQHDPQTGAIIQAGVALGTTSNVDNWPDIVSLMMLQNNADLTQPNSSSAIEALEFYTLFNHTDHVWDDTLPASTQAFSAGKVAIIFGPSWRALEIQAANPSLKWQIYPVPQLPGKTPLNWANFWVEGVPKNSKHSAAAWKLVKFLASTQAQQLLFTTASKERGFGQAPANKALAEQTINHPIIGPYVSSLSSAKTFYTTSLTHDGPTGINSRLIKYLQDAVNGFNQGNVAKQNLVDTLTQGFSQVLSQFGIITTTPSPTP